MSIKKIAMLLIMLLFLGTTAVLANNKQVLIQGEDTANVGETKTLIVKIFSDTAIGYIEGKIEKNENIFNMTIKGKNDWNLTYNDKTGVFNVLKAEGATTEDIMSIEYTTSTTEGTGEITISDIELATIEYETVNIDNLTKEILITKEEEKQEEEKEEEEKEEEKKKEKQEEEKQEQEQEKQEQETPEEVKLESIKIVKAPNKTTYIEGEKFEITGMEIEASYSDRNNKKVDEYTYTPEESLKTTDNKITISYTEKGITKTVDQEIVVKEKAQDTPTKDNEPETPKKEETDDTLIKGNIPKAGILQYKAIMIIIISLISIVCYKKYSKNKDI